MNKVTILGSGTSTGVPILGCKCPVCQSTDVRNKRFRSSVMIETSENKKILIDASPDLRTQLLTNNIDNVDACIITHDHADHTHGIDDLRPFTFKSQKSLPVFTNKYTAECLRVKFPYIFQRDKVYGDRPILGGGIPQLDLEEIENVDKKILDENFQFYLLPHGYDGSLSFLHDKFGYVIDCKNIPDEVLKKFHDARLDLLIIDCLRMTPHQTHLHLDLTLEYIKAINPKLAILTHMGHELDYLSLLGELEKRGMKNIQPGIDGQSFFYSK